MSRRAFYHESARTHKIIWTSTDAVRRCCRCE